MLMLCAFIWGTAFVAQSAGSGMGAYSFLAGRSWLAVLVSLGRKQLTELAEDPNGIELTCQFCDSRQRFTPEEIRELLEKASEA